MASNPLGPVCSGRIVWLLNTCIRRTTDSGLQLFVYDLASERRSHCDLNKFSGPQVSKSAPRKVPFQQRTKCYLGKEIKAVTAINPKPPQEKHVKAQWTCTLR